MKIKTSELIGPALDWTVQSAQGLDYEIIDGLPITGRTTYDSAGLGFDEVFTPSTDWAQGGLIIEREEIDIKFCNPAAGWAADGFRCTRFGPTPLIAAMRCYVASKLGDEAEVPDELT